MKTHLIYRAFLILALIFLAKTSFAQDLGPNLEITDADCDIASSAIAGLIERAHSNKLSSSEKAVYPPLLRKNILSYAGEDDKCLMVSPDFVRVLSIDALAEFKISKDISLFEKLLKYNSEFQPGNIRQHAAVALEKLKAGNAFESILKSTHDKKTFLVGHRDSVYAKPKLQIDEIIKSEKRDLREDPFSYPVLSVLNSLVSPKHFEILKKSILKELKLYEKNSSNWNDSIRADMLRIAAKSGKTKSLELILMHKDLKPIDHLRALAYLKGDPVIIKPLVKIIKRTAKDSQSVVMEETKLALYMLLAIKDKMAPKALRYLTKSKIDTISFMGHKFLALQGRELSIKSIKSTILLVPNRLKIEGIKLFVDLEDRNALPLIKAISQIDLRLKVYSIWALTKLNVIDFQKDADKLLKGLKKKDEDLYDIDIKGSLLKSIEEMKVIKPSY